MRVLLFCVLVLFACSHAPEPQKASPWSFKCRVCQTVAD